MNHVKKYLWERLDDLIVEDNIIQSWSVVKTNRKAKYDSVFCRVVIGFFCILRGKIKCRAPPS